MPKINRLPLTEREQEVLNIIKAAADDDEPMPTRAEIAATLKLPATTGRSSVHMALQGLVKKGRIKLGRGWRNIKIISEQ